MQPTLAVQVFGGSAHSNVAIEFGFRGVGTTFIDPTLLSSLRSKTTHPPQVYTGVVLPFTDPLVPQ